MTATSTIRRAPEPAFEEPDAAEVVLRGFALPFTIRPERPLTDEELLRFCEDNDGLEVESDADGSITVKTPAWVNTSRLNRILVTKLSAWAMETGDGEVFGPDLGVRFHDLVLRAPDAAWLSAKRWREVEKQENVDPGFLRFCPEFVAELRSASDRASKIEAKMEFWMSRGAELGWLIDPQRKLAMIYRPGREPETLLQPEFLPGEGPIDGFRLETRAFWE
jgi:Uma2 family endonuclease